MSSSSYWWRSISRASTFCSAMPASVKVASAAAANMSTSRSGDGALHGAAPSPCSPGSAARLCHRWCRRPRRAPPSRSPCRGSCAAAWRSKGTSILVAQPLDGYLNHVGVAVEVHVPHQFGDGRLRQDLALAPGQHGQQQRTPWRSGRARLPPRERPCARSGRSAGRRCCSCAALLRLAPAPHQRLQPREQLQEGKGLDQVVVGARVQAA
jgi:hypothetical protein